MAEPVLTIKRSELNGKSEIAHQHPLPRHPTQPFLQCDIKPAVLCSMSKSSQIIRSADPFALSVDDILRHHLVETTLISFRGLLDGLNLLKS